MRILRLATLVGAIGAYMAPALAADLAPAPAPLPPPPLVPSGWEFTSTLPMWATWLTGNVGVGRLPTASVNASFGDLLRHLEGILAGTFVASNDTFIIGTDFLWTRIGADVDFKVGGNGPFADIRAGSSASMTLNYAFVTAFAGYRIPIGSPNLSLYGTVGGRYQYLGVDINLTHQFPNMVFSASTSQNVDWADPVVGFAAKYRFNENWFATAYADIGGFGVGSKLTSEDLVAVGYNWTKSVSTEVGFKALYTDYERDNGNGGSFRYNSWFYGPYAGLSYHF